MLEVYLIDYQSLLKLDCLQIIRKWLFSLKNKNFNPSLGRWGVIFNSPRWFSLENLETIKAVTLGFCSS